MKFLKVEVKGQEDIEDGLEVVMNAPGCGDHGVKGKVIDTREFDGDDGPFEKLSKVKVRWDDGVVDWYDANELEYKK